MPEICSLFEFVSVFYKAHAQRSKNLLPAHSVQSWKGVGFAKDQDSLGVRDVAFDVSSVDQIGHQALHLVHFQRHLLPLQRLLQQACTRILPCTRGCTASCFDITGTDHTESVSQGAHFEGSSTKNRTEVHSGARLTTPPPPLPPRIAAGKSSNFFNILSYPPSSGHYLHISLKNKTP
jgi:hypothetical protein